MTLQLERATMIPSVLTKDIAQPDAGKRFDMVAPHSYTSVWASINTCEPRGGPLGVWPFF